MEKSNFKIFINQAREDFKMAIDDIFNAIEILGDDMEKLKADKKTLE